MLSERPVATRRVRHPGDRIRDVVVQPFGESSRDLPEAVKVVGKRDELRLVAEPLKSHLDTVGPYGVPNAPDMGKARGSQTALYPD